MFIEENICFFHTFSIAFDTSIYQKCDDTLFLAHVY